MKMWLETFNLVLLHNLLKFGQCSTLSSVLTLPFIIRHIWLTCLHPCCHLSQIVWWFINWKVTINFIVLFVHISMQSIVVTSQMNHHMIWIGWPQGWKNGSWIRVLYRIRFLRVFNEVVVFWDFWLEALGLQFCPSKDRLGGTDVRKIDSFLTHFGDDITLESEWS